MTNKLGVQILAGLLMTSMIAGETFAVTPKRSYSVYTNQGVRVTQSFKNSLRSNTNPQRRRTNSRRSRLIFGGSVGAGIASAVSLVGPVVHSAMTGGGAAAAGGAVAFSATAGATMGASIGAAAAVVVAAVVIKKLNQRYKARPIGIPSTVRVQLAEDAAKAKDAYDAAVKASTSKDANGKPLDAAGKVIEEPATLEQEEKAYIKGRIDQICKAEGLTEGADMEKTKWVERTTNFLGRLRGKNYLTAYNEDNRKVRYDYIKGTPNIVVTHIACIDPADHSVKNDPYYQQVVAKRKP